jgi:hypothetical protein
LALEQNIFCFHLASFVLEQKKNGAPPQSDPCGYHWLLLVSQPVWFSSFIFTLLGHRVVACFHLLLLSVLSQPCDPKQLFLDWSGNAYIIYKQFISPMKSTNITAKVFPVNGF